MLNENDIKFWLIFVVDICRMNFFVLVVFKRVVLYMFIMFIVFDDNCMIYVYNFNVFFIFIRFLFELLNLGVFLLILVKNMVIVIVLDYCLFDIFIFIL